MISSIVEILEEGERAFAGISKKSIHSRDAFKSSESFCVMLGPKISMIKRDKYGSMYVNSYICFAKPIYRVVRAYKDKDPGDRAYKDYSKSFLSSSKTTRSKMYFAFGATSTIAIKLTYKSYFYIEISTDIEVERNDLVDALNNTLRLNKRVDVGLGFSYGSI